MKAMSYEAAMQTLPPRQQQLIALLDKHRECRCGYGEVLPHDICAKCNTDLFAFVQTHRLSSFNVEETMLLRWAFEPLARSTAQ